MALIYRSYSHTGAQSDYDYQAYNMQRQVSCVHCLTQLGVVFGIICMVPLATASELCSLLDLGVVFGIVCMVPLATASELCPLLDLGVVFGIVCMIPLATASHVNCVHRLT